MPTPEAKFEGQNDGHKCFIFDYGDAKQSDVYIQTKREIGE